MKLILASNSPRRKEILQMLGKPFEVRESRADEDYDPASLTGFDISRELAKRKAEAIQILDSDEIVIGCDTTVIKDAHTVIGKPKDRLEAIATLEGFSGARHSVVTGICVRSKEKTYTEVVHTAVYFRKLSLREIEHYVDTAKPYDKAGAYGIQELAGAFVEKIDGDFYNVVGLPLCRLCQILRDEFGIELY